MGTREKYWATAKQDGVADGARSSCCITAARKLVRIWHFFSQKENKNLVFAFLGLAKQIAALQ